VLARLRERVAHLPHLAEGVFVSEEGKLGVNGRGLAALVKEDRLRRILRTLLDETEFLGPYGIRALSRFHRDHPYVFHVGRDVHKVAYCPAESDSGLFGGNSNWRGPVWVPMNVLVLRALLQYFLYFGPEFRVECPTGSGRWMDLYAVAREIAARLVSIFLPDEHGRRPVFGGQKQYEDPRWRDHLLFYEYFHGDDGAGVGASHQTGWTGLLASLIQLFGSTDPDELLRTGQLGGRGTGALAPSNRPGAGRGGGPGGRGR
jgi:hypothetical protein